MRIQNGVLYGDDLCLRAVAIQPLSGCKLRITPMYGLPQIVDLEPFARSRPELAPLLDPEVFCSVELYYGVPIWVNEAFGAKIYKEPVYFCQTQVGGQSPYELYQVLADGNTFWAAKSQRFQDCVGLGASEGEAVRELMDKEEVWLENMSARWE